MLIEATGLRKVHGRRVVVDGVSLSVAEGETWALLGPNGAGKTSLLRMLAGLSRPTAGALSVRGPVGLVPDRPGVHPLRSGRDHLRVLARLGGFGEDRVGEVLRDVELEEHADRPAGVYSLGMRQRLAVAGALLGGPGLLLLDEPGTGLDPRGARWLRELITGHAAGGGATVLATHALADVERVATHALVLVDGGVAATSAVRTGDDLERLYLEATG